MRERSTAAETARSRRNVRTNSSDLRPSAAHVVRRALAAVVASRQSRPEETDRFRSVLDGSSALLVVGHDKLGTRDDTCRKKPGSCVGALCSRPDVPPTRELQRVAVLIWSEDVSQAVSLLA